MIIMCVHSHSSVNLWKYHVNYLPAAVEEENTMTMATAMKNANDTTLFRVFLILFVYKMRNLYYIKNEYREYTTGISIFSVGAKTHGKIRIPSEKYFSDGVPSENNPQK